MRSANSTSRNVKQQDVFHLTQLGEIETPALSHMAHIFVPWCNEPLAKAKQPHAFL